MYYYVNIILIFNYDYVLFTRILFQRATNLRRTGHRHLFLVHLIFLIQRKRRGPYASTLSTTRLNYIARFTYYSSPRRNIIYVIFTHIYNIYIFYLHSLV